MERQASPLLGRGGADRIFRYNVLVLLVLRQRQIQAWELVTNLKNLLGKYFQIDISCRACSRMAYQTRYNTDSISSGIRVVFAHTGWHHFSIHRVISLLCHLFIFYKQIHTFRKGFRLKFIIFLLFDKEEVKACTILGSIDIVTPLL